MLLHHLITFLATEYIERESKESSLRPPFLNTLSSQYVYIISLIRGNGVLEFKCSVCPNLAICLLKPYFSIITP